MSHNNRHQIINLGAKVCVCGGERAGGMCQDTGTTGDGVFTDKGDLFSDKAIDT